MSRIGAGEQAATSREIWSVQKFIRLERPFMICAIGARFGARRMLQHLKAGRPPGRGWRRLSYRAQSAAAAGGRARLGGLAKLRPLLIIAGAGSGKTNTLAHRVAHLVVSGADPRRILLLTFSRRAAVEMQRRVERIVARRSARTLAS